MSKNTVKKLFTTGSLVRDDNGTKAIRQSETGGTIITMVASATAVDRDGEVIDAQGWVIPNPLPKLLAGHDSMDVRATIGSLRKVWTEENRLMIEAEIGDDVETAITAQFVADMMRRGHLDQGSVGFTPLAWTDPDGKSYTRDDPGSSYRGVLPGRVYTKQELLEFSIVSVPSLRQSMLVGLRAIGMLEPETPPKAKSKPAPPARSWLDKLLVDEHEKVGAVLSAMNKNRLSSAVESMRAAQADLEQAINAVGEALNSGARPEDEGD